MSDLLERVPNVLSVQDIENFKPFLNNTFGVKKTLVKHNGKLYGNMATSFTYVCLPSFAVPSFLELGAIVKITDAGKCSHGDEIVLIEHF